MSTQGATAMRCAQLATEIIVAAKARGLRIAVAESLTGGLVADALVSVPGASEVFSGGIIAYDTALKHSLLGVDAQLLERQGPVDKEVARQMAEGVRKLLALSAHGCPVSADIAVATTGVAGPDPDRQTGQQPGTVWVGVSDVSGSRAEAMTAMFGSGRQEIRAAAVETALMLLRDALI